MSHGHQYTDEQIAWLKVRGHTPRARLAEMFNLHWGTRLSASAIKGTCQRHGIKAGSDGRFVKGQPRVPGSGCKSANITTFQKGHSPHNRRPIGHVSYCTKSGYMSVKMTDTRVTRKDYVALNRLVWEHYHGPIPPSYIVIFRNGDIYDFRIENLELVSRAVHAVRSKMSYYQYPPELRPKLDALITMKQTLARRKRDAEPRATTDRTVAQ